LLVANPLHPGLNLRLPQARDLALDRALATLPYDADVATQEEAFTHLALGDPNATALPERAETPLRNAYVLVDRDYPESPRLQEYGSALDALVRNGTYRLVSRTGSIELYRNSAIAAPTPAGQ